MTLTLELLPELEERLKEAASKQSVPMNTLAVQILEQHVPLDDRAKKAIALLQSWIDDGDEAEQKETGEYLKRVLDEDRTSDRKLFPPELKGISW